MLLPRALSRYPYRLVDQPPCSLKACILLVLLQCSQIALLLQDAFNTNDSSLVISRLVHPHSFYSCKKGASGESTSPAAAINFLNEYWTRKYLSIQKYLRFFFSRLYRKNISHSALSYHLYRVIFLPPPSNRSFLLPGFFYS